jgi:GNAT superfamily N-acetyltransferase
MINGFLIRNPTQADVKSACQVFETSIPDAFEKEGLGFLKEHIHREIIHKKHLLGVSLDLPGSNIYFLIAKLDGAVVGTISFGTCGEDIKKCTENQIHSVGELGSLYVLPRHQGQGIGSAMINAMVAHLSTQGIDQFCLDSGYKRAQKRWLRKFGVPYKVVKDYWGPDSDHMIWLCKVIDFMKE